jgi:hypothetical protein
MDELLPPTAQLLLRSAALQADHLDEHELRHVLLAAWRGWLVEREVVRQHLSALGVDLQVAYPEGFLPFEVLLSDGLIDDEEDADGGDVDKRCSGEVSDADC